MRGQVRRRFEKMKTSANVRNYFVNSWLRRGSGACPTPSSSGGVGQGAPSLNGPEASLVSGPLPH